MKKINKKVWILIAWSFLRGGKKEEKVSFETAKVEKSDIHTSITATGTIEPVTSVTVGTQVSGIVSKLYVDYNSVVKKGQVIAELDRTNLISELNTAKANLASSELIIIGIRPCMTRDWSAPTSMRVLYCLTERRGRMSAPSVRA